jgi:hypothetical protein
MNKILISLVCGLMLSLSPLVSLADDAAAQAAVQQGLDNGAGLDDIIDVLTGEPHNMSLADATLFAMNNGGEGNNMAFMTAGLDIACADSNARMSVVARELIQALGSDSPEAIEARRLMDTCQPDVYVDEYSPGGRGDISPSV